MIRKLMQSIREFKLFSLLSPLFVVLEVVMEVVIPILMAKLIDDGIDGSGGMDAVMHYGWILLVCCVLSLIFGALAGHFAAFASAGFARNLRHDMFYRVQGYSFSNIDKFSAASLVTRMTTDVTNVQNAYQMLIRVALRSPVMLIFHGNGVSPECETGSDLSGSHSGAGCGAVFHYDTGAPHF